MAKSIRSKIKKKWRAEKRATLSKEQDERVYRVSGARLNARLGRTTAGKKDLE